MEIAARVVDGFRCDAPRRVTLASFRAVDGTVIDRGLYTVFPGPASYTGEDLVEFSCHGGLVAPARLLAALHAAGARPAERGEFTRRAVLNGKLDLVQAEAIGDLIDATAPAQAQAAIRQLDGGLSRRLAVLREGLVELEALLSYDIDFPEEDDGPVSSERIVARLDDVRAQIARLIATAPAGERVREGALLVLAGRPNVGKSSLFNALLGTDRVLVTDMAGTTRDAVEAHTAFLRWPIRLVDTAGLWEAPAEVDRLGVEVSRRYLAAADLILLCVETNRAIDESETEILKERPALLVRTKADLAHEPGGDGLYVSTVTGQGLDTLRSCAAQRVFGDRIALADLEPAITRERHREALGRAEAALNEVRIHLNHPQEPVLAAHHLRQATGALDDLVGTVDIEEVLDRVFRSFCVGK